MSEILDQGTPAPAATPEPAPVETTTAPTPELPATDTQSEPVAQNASEPQEQAPDVPAEASTEPSVDEDPFAEFETSSAKDKAFYEEWFKTKQSHTPNAVRNELYELLSAREEADTFLNNFGGRQTLETLKPTIDAILSPNPTQEAVDAAFEAIETHNPQVMQRLGGRIAEEWVAAVAADPITHVTPLIQHTLRQVFGQAADAYDLNRLMEFVQLDLARDAAGEPLLDIEYARQLFEQNGGYNAFRHQQEKAEYERQLRELRNGTQTPSTQQPQTPQTTEVDIDADLERDFLPKAEAILAKVGYAKDDAEYGLVLDALRYRMRNAPETANIRSFAKAGSYKTADGQFVPGVATNRAYLERKLQTQLINELKVVNGRRKGASAPVSRQVSSPAPQQAPDRPSAPAQTPSSPANGNISQEQFIREMTQLGKAKVQELKQADAIAAGR